MTVLRDDIAAYERYRPELESDHRGFWVVFHAGEFVGVFAQFEDAASEAMDRFGSGPYLIRQIGAEAIQLSASTVFRPAHAYGPGGI